MKEVASATSAFVVVVVGTSVDHCLNSPLYRQRKMVLLCVGLRRNLPVQGAYISSISLPLFVHTMRTQQGPF